MHADVQSNEQTMESQLSSIFDEFVQEQKKVHSCEFADKVNEMDEEAQAAITRALAMPKKEMAGSTIYRVLRKHGIDVSIYQLRRHRTQQCACHGIVVS